MHYEELKSWRKRKEKGYNEGKNSWGNFREISKRKRQRKARQEGRKGKTTAAKVAAEEEQGL